jgi:hypothetical protein
MKKSVITLLVLGLVFASLAGPAEAKKKKKKAPAPVVQTGTYQTPTLGIIGGCAQTDAEGCVSFGVPSTKLIYVSVNITDASGLPVSASIQQATGPVTAGVPGDELIAAFCGKTDSPVAIDPSLEVHVWVDDNPNPDCAPAAATTGTVEATFASKP